jgi:putative FmdB family regulatory protein
MPIYEYYCADCQGRFKHLAKLIDAPAPVCPRCGNASVERLISAVNTIHTNTHHQTQLKLDASQIDAQDPVEIAQFLKNSGRLEDASGIYGSKVYRELVERRAQGAEERDLTDLVDDLASEMRDSTSGEVAGAVLFSEQVEKRMAAEGPPAEHGDKDYQKSENNSQDAKASTVLNADDLGWV